MKVKAKAVLGQLSDMDFRLLQVFKSVADCGSMAAAGLELNIGISTVSRHVKDLEERLKLTLCSRGRAGFALTAEGERIYQETQRLLASADAFRASIDDIHQRMGGQLHIAVFDKTASNPACKISAAIALFAEQAPDVALNFHVATINRIERGVIDGEFQVGIIPAHRSSESLTYDTLFGETMLLYCGEHHPLFAQESAALDWSGIQGFQFAGLGYHSPNMQISQQVRLPRKATGFDQESIATLILSGKYLGFLPDHYARGFVADGKMRALNPPLFRYECDFVSILRGSPRPSRVALAFRQCLLAAHEETAAAHSLSI
ncbi:LysR family transcriptional regulator [Oxalobacteraceae bacterium]|nr:LysR family transcriptional regulator [Oxalobacteraceae bacterium]